MNDLTELVTGTKATLDHIIMIDRKIDGLRDKKFDAEEVFLSRVRLMYDKRLFTIDDLVRFAECECPCFFEPEWEERWEEAGLPPVNTLRDIWCEGMKYTATGPHGSWTNYHPRFDDALPDRVSCTPSDENPMPPRGQNVVYVLYDAFGTPCYVGSSGDFPTRLKWHLKDGKPVRVWIAYPCASRKAAYALEDRLLKQYKPYLNKKAGA